MIKVQSKDFCLADEIDELRGTQSDIGAIVNFIGVVREGAGDKKISSLILEHYPGMTERELERIEQEAHARWDLMGSLIIHRYGELVPGDNIVLVITASRHRTDAFQAAAFLMDYLKTSAPFWKKEIIAGQASWVEAKQSDEKATRAWLASRASESKPGR